MLRHNMRIFQEAVDEVSCYMFSNGFTLSPQKTVFIPFHTNSSLCNDLYVTIKEQNIHPSSVVKYLGVFFGRRGYSNLQVSNNIQNASRALHFIKVLTTQPWANTPKIMVDLVRSLVRSRLTYGLEAMHNISLTNCNHLTEVECRGLLSAVPQSLVYREVGVLPLRDYIQLSCAKYVFRSQTVCREPS